MIQILTFLILAKGFLEKDVNYNPLKAIQYVLLESRFYATKFRYNRTVKRLQCYPTYGTLSTLHNRETNVDKQIEWFRAYTGFMNSRIDWMKEQKQKTKECEG